MIEVVYGKEVNCEKLLDGSWRLSGETKRLKTCDMHLLTRIEEPNVTISKQTEDIFIILFSQNKHISYLPVEVFKTFPQVTVYRASETSIKEISKENFKNLKKLQILYLQSNKIEMIHWDTFQDLQNLNSLHLGE